jgi:hypothetical protein
MPEAFTSDLISIPHGDIPDQDSRAAGGARKTTCEFLSTLPTSVSGNSARISTHSGRELSQT